MKSIKKTYDPDFFNNTKYGIAEVSSIPNSFYKNSRIFALYFGIVPNVLNIEAIDFDKVKQSIEANKYGKLVHTIYRQDYEIETKRNTIQIFSFFLENGIMICIDDSQCNILFPIDNQIEAREIFSKLLKIKKRRIKTTEISLLYETNGGIRTKELKIKKPKINFDMHYNDDFFKVHKQIVLNCKKENTKGLYLFHGQPGTGKSTYIKYLLHQLYKKVIFISPKIAGQLDNTSMTSFLLENKNTIIVIEDAEELIVSRDNVRNSNLSMLLNLTDGLIGDSLGIQIIATFNTNVKDIDKALLRKGRLTAIYEFKPLTKEKTNTLLNSIGYVDIEIESKTISDIMNFHRDNNYVPNLKKVIGFQ